MRGTRALFERRAVKPRRRVGLFGMLAGASMLAAAASPLDGVINAPLLSANKERPVEIIASRWWVVTDGASATITSAIDPDRQFTQDKRVDLGTFTVDGDKGPVSLVVDYGAMVESFSGARGSVRISIECLERPLECAIPVNKTVLMFHADLMAKVPIELSDSRQTFAIGRESQTYRLPAGEPVRVELELGSPHDLSPLLVKAWLIYGENATDVVPGQTSRSKAMWIMVTVGAVALVLLLRRLLRR